MTMHRDVVGTGNTSIFCRSLMSVRARNLASALFFVSAWKAAATEISKTIAVMRNIIATFDDDATFDEILCCVVVWLSYAKPG